MQGDHLAPGVCAAIVLPPQGGQSSQIAPPARKIAKRMMRRTGFRRGDMVSSGRAVAEEE